MLQIIKRGFDTDKKGEALIFLHAADEVGGRGGDYLGWTLERKAKKDWQRMHFDD